MKHFIFILLILTTIGCEEDLTLNDVPFTPSIVINSVFTSDSLWSVTLSTSHNIYIQGDKSQYIEDATVVITEPNGQTVCELNHVGKGCYKSEGCFPTVDKKYIITVNTPTYGQATAQSSLPAKAKVKVLNVDTINNEVSVNFNIEDQSLLNNFFIWDLVEIETINDSVVGDINPSNRKIDVSTWVRDLSVDITFVKKGIIRSELSAVENALAGDPISSSVTFDTSKLDENPPSGDPKDPKVKRKTMLRIMTVSKELYNYYKSIETYLGYEDFQSSVSDPVNAYSNVKGGLGIFAGYSLEYVHVD